MAPWSALTTNNSSGGVAVSQNPSEAALQFARTEGIIPAPEPSHAIRVVIDEAIRCRERGERKTIAFVLCGHGHFDLASYERYLTGQLEDFELPQSAIDEALSLVPGAERLVSCRREDRSHLLTVDASLIFGS
jgi:hypothetical protein